MNEKEEVFRCGYCGTPTDKDGNPMNQEYCESLTPEQLDNATLNHGYCCYNEVMGFLAGDY